MEQTQQMIMQQLAALSQRHPALGSRLVQAANTLLSHGTPISEGLLAELVKYSRDFNQVKQQLRIETQNTPNAEISLNHLKQKVQNQVQHSPDLTLRQNSLKLLEGIICLAHKDQETYQPLQVIQQQASQLKTLISSTTEPLPATAKELVSGQHPFSALLTLIKQQDRLSDTQWVVLEEKVAKAFGKSLAVAISRGKIYQSTNKSQPQSLKSDIVILEEPTPSQTNEIIIVPSLEIPQNLPQNLPQTQSENIIFGNAPIASQSSAPGVGSTIGLNVTVHLQGLGERQFSAKEYAGTRGQGRRLEGFALGLDPQVRDLGIQYMAHVAGVGDTPMVSGGQWVGETGRERKIEGFAVSLTGSQAENYDVFYNAHIQNKGDVPVCSNGEYCGTRGESLRVEGISVWIQPKS
ncbi:MAG: hydrogenase [Microcoleaceae cyanobacterium]